MTWRDEDDDARRDAIDERRAMLREMRCQCGNDMPGWCPGPRFCPHSDYNREDEDSPQ